MPGNSEATCAVRARCRASARRTRAPGRGPRARAAAELGRRTPRPPPPGHASDVGAGHRVHPGRVDVDVVEQGLAGPGLVALGVAAGQEALVAPPDVQVAASRPRRGPGRRRARPASRCRRVPPVSTSEAEPLRRLGVDQPGDQPGGDRLGEHARRRGGRSQWECSRRFSFGRGSRRGQRPRQAAAALTARTCASGRVAGSRPRRSRRGPAAAAPRRAARRSAAAVSATLRSGWPGRDSIATRPSAAGDRRCRRSVVDS